MDHNYHIKEMTKETAFKAIDFLMKHSQESDVCNIVLKCITQIAHDLPPL